MLCLLAAVAALAGCAGDDEDDELPPGSVARIGVAAVPGGREALVPRGVQVAAAAINAAGGIGGAARIELVIGPVERLLDRGIRLLVLPCDQQGALAGARLVQRRGAVAVAPCDDGILPSLSRVFQAGLSPQVQADLLADRLAEPVSFLPPATQRGRLVERLLSERLQVVGSEPTAGTDAPERVLPPADAPDGVLFVTYGFPEPGTETDEFYERYKALFGRRPFSIVAALAADALGVLAAAIEIAATTEPGPVAAVIGEEGVEVAGALGEIEFPGGTTQPSKVPAVVLRVERGRYRVVGRIR